MALTSALRRLRALPYTAASPGRNDPTSEFGTAPGITRILAGLLLFGSAGVAVAALAGPAPLAARLGLVASGLASAGAALLWRAARQLERAEVGRATAEEELNRRLSELFSLQELSYVLSESLQLERIVEQVVRFAMRFLDARGALIGLSGEDPAAPLRVVAAEGTLAALKGQVTAKGEDGLLVQSLGRERLDLVTADAGQPIPIAGGVTAGAAAAVPLRAHGVVVGSLVVVEPRGGTFAPEDVRLLSTLATHAAIVLANARFFEMIRAAKEQWETAFDALTEGVAVVNAEGRVRRANRALAQMLGTPLPATIGQHLCHALLGKSEALMSLLVAAGHDERPTPLIARSEPLKRIFRITAAPMQRGQPERESGRGGAVVLVEDVTEQRALETQLIQHERLAAIGQLVSGVAHELNNPLTSVAGLSEFLLEQPQLGHGDREHLRVIHEQAERAGRIVRNLLTFARRGKPEMARVDLNDLVQRTLSLMTYDLTLREITVQRHFRRNLPDVLGDRYALQQVVLNLIANAAQSVSDNPSDRPREIRVETALEQERVVFRVRDTGAGIPEEDLVRLFEPFFTTKPSGEGTGLGLSICYNIVQNHAGRLTVESPPEGGAVFLVQLPPAPADAPKRVSVPDMPVARAPAATGARRTILLVDDDQAVQRLVSALFVREGHVVDVGRTGPEALGLLREKAYDLVIADARTAVNPGLLFIEAAVDKQPDLRPRILVATGDVRPETDERVQRLGVRLVRKPFNLRELREAAARVWEETADVTREA